MRGARYDMSCSLRLTPRAQGRHRKLDITREDAPALFARGEYQDGQVAELCGLGGEGCEGVFGDAFVG